MAYHTNPYDDHLFTVLWLGLWGKNHYVVHRAMQLMNMDPLHFVPGNVRTKH